MSQDISGNDANFSVPLELQKDNIAVIALSELSSMKFEGHHLQNKTAIFIAKEWGNPSFPYLKTLRYKILPLKTFLIVIKE